MIDELERAWESQARAALAWREGQSIAPVLEALALCVALEVTGGLATAPSRLREDLRRTGQRALLHTGGELALTGTAEGEDAEDESEALRIAVALARDGLRALSGRALEPEPERDAPSARDLARLLSGRADPFEAATIARAVRRSPRARAELRWALSRSHEGAGAPIVLAAADGEAMRDPAEGRLVATVSEAEGVIAEVYVFADARLAAYASSDLPLRIEGAGVVTEVVQPGYWSGHVEAQGAHELAIVLGEARHPVHLVLG